MCGILFAYTRDPENDAWYNEAALEQASTTLQARGPDASKVVSYDFEVGRAIMCFHRLAIINCSDTGMQPFEYMDSKLICSGEIYNYKDLVTEGCVGKSDTEVVLHLLANTATSDIGQALRKLDGDFAFVYTDSSRIIAARDPVGVRPMFFATKASKVVAFASEAKALVPFGFDSVHVFPPGHYWCSDATPARVAEPLHQFALYTDAYSDQRTPCTFKEDLGDVTHLITDSIRKRIEHSDRPVAFLCSGGVDSSIIVSIASQLFPERDMHAFSVEFENAHSQDSVYATELLKALPNVKHTRVILKEQDIQELWPAVVMACETYDATTVRAAIPMFHLAKYIAENTPYKVVLSGEGADEVFMGYSYFSCAPSVQLANLESERLVKNLHMFDLLRGDRCFAANGLELRVPFLDRCVLRHAMSSQNRLVATEEKKLLRDAFAHVQALERTGILRRGKMRLSDGVGYSMVDSIVDVISGHDSSATPEWKVDKERAKVEEVFLRKYGMDALKLIVKRTMPEWATAMNVPVLAGYATGACAFGGCAL
ncbi:asparagine synthase-domain-containing protein [Tribonema minus]|uniref:asparagine synthase (glutamine-hydrolyzing) n=1 Tax=Tribonema minus TaxID=303371 RepID=A0A835Z2L2_9STRA|nr:asparagine synthase-domain-containing protein [Tribonema minus]